MKLSKFLIRAVPALVMVGCSNVVWAARCSEDLANQNLEKYLKSASRNAAPEKVEVEPPVEPMTQLQAISREAAKRSASLGAARLLAEAAEFDLTETKAGRWPTVSVNGTLGAIGNQVGQNDPVRQKQASVSLNVSANLYDGGRLRQLMAYRNELLGAARYGAAVTQDQVVLEAISAALERSRYKLQAQVYQQYMRKMSCLVEALEGIVAEDKGRTSELIQVRKTQAQTELQRDQALAQSRQSELKLRKLVGDLNVTGDGFTLPLSVVPEIGEINRQIEFGSDAQQLRTQADAADAYAQAVAAGQRPQLNWNVGKTEARQGGTPVSSWQAGVTLSYSLFNGFSDDAAAQAALRRAQATRSQLTDLLNTKYARTAEVYDIATSAFDRAKRYVDVLRDSERVRNFTFQQWSQIGKRSLFDVMSAESDHFNLRISYVNALYDGYQATAQLRAMGSGLSAWVMPEQR